MSKVSVDTRVWAWDGLAWCYSIALTSAHFPLSALLWGWKPEGWKGCWSRPGLCIVVLALGFWKLAGHITDVKQNRAGIWENAISVCPRWGTVMRTEKGNCPPGSRGAVSKSNRNIIPSGTADLHIRDTPSRLLAWPRPINTESVTRQGKKQISNVQSTGIQRDDTLLRTAISRLVITPPSVKKKNNNIFGMYPQCI